MFSIPTAPAKQSVSETITVLSGRLSSATLLEDRRAAILGLRSFAKDYPASVASGALRSLIGSLNKDGEDVDTVKVVLETLLMLFSPNEDSPEASEEIALWLADEFTQRQENITLLLDFVDTSDFYSRLYSLQLLVAILSARTERTEECVFTAPLGISRLVSVLDDHREAIRNEGIGLLTYLTPSSVEIQKLVAFENAFDRLFAIIDADGALADGGRTVEDCLILLANLLRGNISNQSLFRESGCINRLAELLARALQVQRDAADIASWAQAQKNRNIYAFLAVIRLFLTRGSVGTPQNQMAIWKHGLAYHVLQLAFNQEAQTQIKAEALITCGDVIRENATLQESFAQLMVPSPIHQTDGLKELPNGLSKIYVIDGLLDLTLTRQDVEGFDVRFAACECLKAYFAGHNEVRLHFLSRAIEGHQSGRDETANVLTVLLQPIVESSIGDPYRYWFAAVITFHLIYDNPAAKATAMGLKEGDSSDGEEEVTGIQTVAAHIISGLNRGDDARVLIGYLMLLLGWLYEDLDAVNDFLTEGSNVQSLIQAVTQPIVAGNDLVQGLCTMLLGIVYEFSTKDSPIPRATLHSVLTARLDREQYLNRLAKLRGHPLMRDFEVTPQKFDISSPNRLPDVFFDNIFVEFFKDSYSRVSRSLDRDPGIEISVFTNGVQKGISRELVDSLRNQLDEKERALQEAQGRISMLEAHFNQEQIEHRRTKDAFAKDKAQIQSANEGLQKQHEDELRNLQSQQAAKDNEYQKEIHNLRTQQATKEAENQKQLLQVRKMAEIENDRLQRRTEAEMADLKATISRLEVDLMKVNKSKSQELQRLRDEHRINLQEVKTNMAEIDGHNQELQARLEEAQHKNEKDSQGHKAELVEYKRKSESRTSELQKQLEEAKQSAEELKEKARAAETALSASVKAKEAAQSELEDLLMVFGDLEEKVAKYKARLSDLGEAVSEGEEDDDSEEDEDSGDEDKDSEAGSGDGN